MGQPIGMMTDVAAKVLLAGPPLPGPGTAAESKKKEPAGGEDPVNPGFMWGLRLNFVPLGSYMTRSQVGAPKPNGMPLPPGGNGAKGSTSIDWGLGGGLSFRLGGENWKLLFGAEFLYINTGSGDVGTDMSPDELMIYGLLGLGYFLPIGESGGIHFDLLKGFLGYRALVDGKYLNFPSDPEVDGAEFRGAIFGLRPEVLYRYKIFEAGLALSYTLISGSRDLQLEGGSEGIHELLGMTTVGVRF